jgi:large subunit ribosomal protein L18
VFKNKSLVKKARKLRIRKRIRKKISGTPERPRVCVYKSNRYIYSQAIDDQNQAVLASASTVEKEFREKNKKTKTIAASSALGSILAERLKKKKVKEVILDRGTYPYHGRVKALAEALRKGDLIF